MKWKIEDFMVFLVMCVTALMILALFTKSAHAENWYRKLNTEVNDIGHGLDHALHFTAGSIISYQLDKKTDLPKWAVASAPLLVGIVKESTDRNFDALDLSGWAFAGIFTTYILPEFTQDDLKLFGFEMAPKYIDKGIGVSFTLRF